MSYANLAAHMPMVFDDVRNSHYRNAIRQYITPDSVVLDLGAGLGILGLIAAAEGARMVYMVEPETVVSLAQEFARANGLQDRITILEGKIEEIELPEKVDIILSVFTGNLLYTEDLLPSLFYARDRFLKEGGKLLPDRAELLMAPVDDRMIHDTNIGRWSRLNQGLDFSAGRRFVANDLQMLSTEHKSSIRLASGTVLASVDFTTATHADCFGEVSYRVTKSGECNGMLGWIRLLLGSRWLSTDPLGPDVHWSPVMLPVDPAVVLTEGEDLGFRLQRPARGDWTWTLQTANETRRHSTFLARTDAPRHLQKLAPDYSPDLNLQGEKTVLVLLLMNAGKSNLEIAERLMTRFPQLYPERDIALREIQDLAWSYARNE